MPSLPPDALQLLMQMMARNPDLAASPGLERTLARHAPDRVDIGPTGFDQPNVVPHPSAGDPADIRAVAEDPNSPMALHAYAQVRGHRPPAAANTISEDPWFDVDMFRRGNDTNIVDMPGSTGLPRDIKSIFEMPPRGDGRTYLEWLRQQNDETLTRIFLVSGYDQSLIRDEKSLRSLAGRLALEGV